MGRGPSQRHFRTYSIEKRTKDIFRNAWLARELETCSCLDIEGSMLLHYNDHAKSVSARYEDYKY
jgi:hypothetical protein